ncbi:MAG: hypothetical protein H6757_00955 [Candidatus Omnitrophica bacterium]|nr:hypothetical protein [Candidatus Omnitrophota bacterium]
MSQWGRFTARGSVEVEERITAIMTEVCERLKKALAPQDCDAVVLLGGYGRGEGGVLREGGIEKPHNNFDLLMITRTAHPKRINALRIKASTAIEDLAGKYKVEFDIGVIARSKLQKSPSLVMWYDMRHGHKILLGPKDYVSGMSQFELEKIPVWDVENLLINRGTLVIINDLIIEQKDLDEKIQRLIIKHTIKAIIGYGDALLYFLGKYHWSYCEKQKRMAAAGEIPASFKQLYNEAMNFRFEPDYQKFMANDLCSWVATIKETLQSIHLACERLRYQRPDLDWNGYHVVSMKNMFQGEKTSLKVWLKRGINFLKEKDSITGFPVFDRFRLGLFGMKNALALIFPVIAYELKHKDFLGFTQKLLSTQNQSPEVLRKIYLRKWAVAGDTNFKTVIKRYALNLQE